MKIESAVAKLQLENLDAARRKSHGKAVGKAVVRVVVRTVAKTVSQMHDGRKWKKTQTKLPSNNSLSHERGSERSERASERVSTVEGASEVSSPEQANE